MNDHTATGSSTCVGLPDSALLELACEINDRHGHMLSAINVILHALAREIERGDAPDDLPDQLRMIRAESDQALRESAVLDQRLRERLSMPAPLTAAGPDWSRDT